METVKFSINIPLRLSNCIIAIAQSFLTMVMYTVMTIWVRMYHVP